MRTYLSVLLAAGVLIVMTGCGGPQKQAADDLSPQDQRQWAQKVEEPGLPNLYRVSDYFWRGGPPTDEGLARLRELGIRTIVSMRNFHAPEFENAYGMEVVHLPMWAFICREDDLLEFLTLATDSRRAPVYVYCMRGADRTGVMAAAYRVVVQGWDKEEAISEMKEGGFGFIFHFANLSDCIRELDVVAVRRQLLKNRPHLTQEFRQSFQDLANDGLRAGRAGQYANP